ncbi:MAG TPA: hypothetical protein VJY41_08915 [Prolixibacteraceae bacterium]|nr:hypothetical protein [Prolixibacteraceae bacterium]
MKNRIEIIVVFIAFVVSIVFPNVSSGQIKYGIAINGGGSNLMLRNKSFIYDEEGSIVGKSYNSVNFYTSNYMYGIEGFVIEPLRQSKFSLEQGLAFESVSYFNNIPQVEFANDTIFAKNWEERFYDLSIPLKIRYNITKWFVLNGGIDNVFNLKLKSEVGSNLHSNIYRLKGELGFDVIFFEKLILGCKYSNDITPLYRYQNDDRVSFRIQSVSVKLGVVF